MVDYVSDPNALQNELDEFVYSSDCPEQLKERLQSLTGSQADIITKAPEILFGFYEELNLDGKKILGRLCQYAINQGFTAVVQGNRWPGIVRMVARDTEGAEFDDTIPMSDPEPLPHYVPTPEPEPVEGTTDPAMTPKINPDNPPPIGPEQP